MRGTQQKIFRVCRLRWVILQVLSALFILTLSSWTPSPVSAGESKPEGAGSGASWFIDQGRFHASVHGQLSCMECHEAASKVKPHPDPTHVDRKAGSFFSIDPCMNCHDEVVAKIESGTHAGKPGTDVSAQKACVNCHDPHYQLSSTNLAASFNRAQPVGTQCGACHAAKTGLPALSSADKKCMDCHGLAVAGDPAGISKISLLCFSCHGEDAGVGDGFAKMDVKAYGAATHGKLACLSCHPESAEYGHAGRKRTECLRCHRRHDEKVAHDAHLSVSCEACHLAGATPVKKAESGAVLHAVDRKQGHVQVHQMRLKGDESSCGKCHFSGNSLGASAMVLPAKSVICMPCHAATFSVGDTVSIVALLVFLGGVGLVLAFLFSGGVRGESKASGEMKGRAPESGGTPFLVRIARVLEVIVFDVFLQRKLLKRSMQRWLIHGLIFFPFLFRFIWGMVALLGSLYAPASSLPWKMLDKNDPLGGLLFDLSGLMILLGILLAGVRWYLESKKEPTGLPRSDWPALCLVGSIVIIGFVLEGMRIAMTGFPSGARYSFAGYALGGIFGYNTALGGIYGYAWYLHAIVTGAVVAYLPFSQLIHIITSPVVMVWSAATKTGRH